MKLFLFLVAAMFSLSFSADARMELKEDISCKEVNYAYVAMRSTINYTEKVYGMNPDGSLIEWSELRFDRTQTYQRQMPNGVWSVLRRWNWSTFDRFGPKFKTCKFEDTEIIDGQLTKRYSTTWHKYPYVAASQIWVSVEHNRIVKTTRRYGYLKEWQFDTLVEILDYSPKPPLGLESPM